MEIAFLQHKMHENNSINYHYSNLRVPHIHLKAIILFLLMQKSPVKKKQEKFNCSGNYLTANSRQDLETLSKIRKVCLYTIGKPIFTNDFCYMNM